jgi:hypothetical protein
MPYHLQTLHPDTIARRQMWARAGRGRDTSAIRAEGCRPKNADDAERQEPGERPANSATSAGGVDAL